MAGINAVHEFDDPIRRIGGTTTILFFFLDVIIISYTQIKSCCILIVIVLNTVSNRQCFVLSPSLVHIQFMTSPSIFRNHRGFPPMNR